MYRACELSSGRRRHWKNRTEINRSVFFAELEHRSYSSSSSHLPAPQPPHHLLLPPVCPLCRTTLVLPPPRRAATAALSHSVDRYADVPSFRRCSSYLDSDCVPSSQAPEEFTVLLPDRPGRLRCRTLRVDRTFSFYILSATSSEVLLRCHFSDGETVSRRP